MRKSRIPWPVGAGLAVAAGLTLYWAGIPRLVETFYAVPIKLRGKAPGCTWSRVLTFFRDNMRFVEMLDAVKPTLQVKDFDAALGIEKIVSPRRTFWIPRQGAGTPGLELLTYLLADQDWLQEESAGKGIRKGDIVLDCGGHVGVFTNKALELGAEKVIAIEPNPVNIECLRRNFPAEIASGRVVIVPKGVWSSAGSFTLHIGVQNSGMGSMLHDQGGGKVEIPTIEIDVLVRELSLPRVDYIKMDIEGAEREALKGALATLKRFRPRLMLDSYHEPDDMVVLPGIIRQAHAGYRLTCGPCQPRDADPTTFVPHTTFFD
ncbi:MAG: FkbM family methyltransferase [Bryobacteraceae bacterium]